MRNLINSNLDATDAAGLNLIELPMTIGKKGRIGYYDEIFHKAHKIVCREFLEPNDIIEGICASADYPDQYTVDIKVTRTSAIELDLTKIRDSNLEMYNCEFTPSHDFMRAHFWYRPNSHFTLILTYDIRFKGKREIL